MNQVLLLTKNCLADTQLQQSLQKLNFEVFCSCSVLEMLQYNKDIQELIRFFKIVIISETLSETELTLIMPHLVVAKVFVVRVDHEEPDEQKQSKWKRLGIKAWLVSEDSPGRLREKLNASNQFIYEIGHSVEKMALDGNQKPAGNHPSQNYFGRMTNVLPLNFVEDLRERFSDQEAKIFATMLERRNIPLTREEICEMLWPDAEVEHKLAQISIIVRNIKGKCLELGFEGRTIRTRRGVGYVLCRSFYSLLSEAGAEQVFASALVSM